MLNLVRLIIITLIISFLEGGCYFRQPISKTEPTDGRIENEIQILTKDGRKITCISYEITKEKIVGKDRQGIIHEIKIDNIKEITSLEKQKQATHYIISLL